MHPDLPIGRPFPDDPAVIMAPLRERGLKLNTGRFSYGIPQVYFSESDPKARLSIGSFCSIGGNCQIFVGTAARHYTDFITTSPLGMIFGDSGSSEKSAVTDGDLSVSIGSDVWIGVDTVIMAGVHIGDGAVIGARSVVTRDVRPYAIVGGVPARELRRRFPDRVVARLLSIAWWDWPDATIKANLQLFFRRDHEDSVNEMEAINATIRTGA